MKISYRHPLDFSRSFIFSIRNGIVLVLAVLSLGVAVLCRFYASSRSKVMHTISSSKNNNEKFLFSFSSSKVWDEYKDLNTGAQYDCVLTVKENVTLGNWKCVLQFDDDFYLDSSWNGNMEVTGNQIIITPMEYNSEIYDIKPATFGFVLHTKKVFEQPEYLVTYYKIIAPFDLIVYRVSLILFVFFTVILIILVLSGIRLKRLLKMLDQTFDTIVNIVDTFDEYTCNHSRNVAYYSIRIAEKLGLRKSDILKIYYVALVHDVGKISIMRNMLNKQEKFSDEEKEKMKLHTTAGAEILKDFSSIPEIKEGALYHHERWDGKGYPFGKAGKDIPLFARIICVADSFDAMTTQRPYWNPSSIEDVVDEFKKCSGTQFDPEIVSIMLLLIENGEAPVNL